MIHFIMRCYEGEKIHLSCLYPGNPSDQVFLEVKFTAFIILLLINSIEPNLLRDFLLHHLRRTTSSHCRSINSSLFYFTNEIWLLIKNSFND